MLRLFIVLPVYALVVVVLPTRPEVRTLTEPLLRLDPQLALVVAIIAGGASGLGLWLFRREPHGFLLTRNTVALRVAFMGLIGIFFAAVFHLFERMSGQYSSLLSLILLPIAFMAAEAAYEAIRWRMSQSK